MNRRMTMAGSVAEKILAEFGISAPELIDVEAVAIAKGALVEYAPLKGAAGRLVRDGDYGIIRIDSGIREEGQRRFAGAHELGHYILHERDRNASCRPEDMLAWYKTSKKEQEANDFAASFLMPALLFCKQCDRTELSLDGLERLTEMFRTTLTATAIRYAEIGPHVCAVVQSQKGIIRWFRPGHKFPFRLIAPGNRVVPDSGAHEFFAGRLTKPESEYVLADRWLVDHRIESAWTLREITIPMPSFECALSILWVVPGSKLDHCGSD